MEGREICVALSSFDLLSEGRECVLTMLAGGQCILA